MSPEKRSRTCCGHELQVVKRDLSQLCVHRDAAVHRAKCMHEVDS